MRLQSTLETVAMFSVPLVLCFAVTSAAVGQAPPPHPIGRNPRFDCPYYQTELGSELRSNWHRLVIRPGMFLRAADFSLELGLETPLARNAILNGKPGFQPENNLEGRAFGELERNARRAAEVVVIGFDKPWKNGRAAVSLERFRRPFILVLTCREDCRWDVELDRPSQAYLVDVVVAGEGKQIFNSATVTLHPEIYYKDRFAPEPPEAFAWFHAHQHDEEHYPNLEAALQKHLGKRVDRFYGRKQADGKIWVIDGTESDRVRLTNDGLQPLRNFALFGVVGFAGVAIDPPSRVETGRPYLEFDQRIRDLLVKAGDPTHPQSAECAHQIVTLGMPARFVLRDVTGGPIPELNRRLIERIEESAKIDAPLFLANFDGNQRSEIRVRDVRRPFYLGLARQSSFRPEIIDIDPQSEKYLIEFVTFHQFEFPDSFRLPMRSLGHQRDTYTIRNAVSAATTHDEIRYPEMIRSVTKLMGRRPVVLKSQSGYGQGVQPIHFGPGDLDQ